VAAGIALAPGGERFMLVESDGPTRNPAFDHDRLANELSRLLGTDIAPEPLPFEEIELWP